MMDRPNAGDAVEHRVRFDLDDRHRPTGALIKELFAEGQRLLQEEIRLAKLEVRHELADAKHAARDGAIAGVAGHTALLLFAATVVLILATFLPGWVAALLVTAAFGGVAAYFGQRAKRQLDALKPRKPTEQLKEDTQWAKETMRGAISKARASA